MSNSVFKFLNEDKSRCEFKGKEFEVLTNYETNEKYFVYENNKKYHIIENEKQTIRRELKSDKKINFKRCIFIYIDIKFLTETKKDIVFNDSVFCEDVRIDACEFPSMIFIRTLFEKELNCFGAKFKKSVLFDQSIFNGNVDFYYCEFHSVLQAEFIHCEKDFSIINCDLKRGINLFSSIFEKKLLFSSFKTNIASNKLNGKLFLSNTNIKRLDLRNIYIGEKFSISLSFSSIDEISYSNNIFTKNNVEDRETFLLLKQDAIKKSDHINALDFYKSEMILHTRELSKKKELDYWILKFEEIVSDFGINPIKPIILIIYISFTFSLFVSFFTNSWNVYFENSLLLINPTLSIENILSTTLINKGIAIPPLLEAFNFFKNIIHGILIYETIKSFRKFSRKI